MLGAGDGHVRQIAKVHGIDDGICGLAQCLQAHFYSVQGLLQKQNAQLTRDAEAAKASSMPTRNGGATALKIKGNHTIIQQPPCTLAGTLT